MTENIRLTPLGGLDIADVQRWKSRVMLGRDTQVTVETKCPTCGETVIKLTERRFVFDPVTQQPVAVLTVREFLKKP